MKASMRRVTCRICGGRDLVSVLDLGETPPANAFLRKEQFAEEVTFPLALYFCRTCSLLQLLDVVDPAILFKDYHYLTGASAPLVEYFERYAKDVIVPLVSSPGDLVVDIGGNDGVLLSFLKDRVRVLNIDPAGNLSEQSEARGVPFHRAFFSAKTASEIVAKYGTATVVVANNVFAHIDPIRDVFEGVAQLIGPKGTLIFQVHWAKHLIDEKCFDQIYHEHLCFYSLHAAKYLVEMTGMKVFDVDLVLSQGESLRIYASNETRESHERVKALLDIEKEAGLNWEEMFLQFGRAVERDKEKLRAILLDLIAQNKRIVGYGATAKSSTLLNYCRIGPDILEYITDTTPLKQGLYSPGMHIPIVSPERLLHDTPDYILLLAWNYKASILENEKALRNRGVKFVVPIPDVSIV